MSGITLVFEPEKGGILYTTKLRQLIEKLYTVDMTDKEVFKAVVNLPYPWVLMYRVAYLLIGYRKLNLEVDFNEFESLLTETEKLHRVCMDTWYD